LSPRNSTPVGAANSNHSLFMENIIVGVIALALFAYLFVAMVYPEKF
jgi:K+-transporting ATPase KdpF subunit